MSILDSARSVLAELPIASVQRERLAFALDRLAEAEAKMVELQTQAGRLEAQLEREQLDHRQTRQEKDALVTALQALRAEHEEDVRILDGFEFRLGKRTGGRWLPFCPVCHLPVQSFRGRPRCSSPACQWSTDRLMSLLDQIGAAIPT